MEDDKKMRILFIRGYLSVKQYHLACALTDKYEVDCDFAHLYPSNGYDFLGSKFYYPKLKWMAKHILKNAKGESEITKHVIENDPTLPFNKIASFSKFKKDLKEYDWIYLSSYCMRFPRQLKSLNNLWVDIEDLILLREKALEKQLASEKFLIENSNFVTFGSNKELELAKLTYGLTENYATVYPRVARRTIPKIFSKKTNKFSVVVIGGFYNTGYRNYFPTIKEILKLNPDTTLTLYLVNSHNKFMWNLFKQLEVELSNFTVKPFVSYGLLKQEISKYHVGLIYLPSQYEKLSATFGMKPFEYVYAKVQPCSIGKRLIDPYNNKEFGYRCDPTNIQENFKENMKNFDYEKNLMDNNLPGGLWK